VPRDGVAVDGVQPRALRTIVGVVFAPGVVVQDEIAFVRLGILVTEISPAGERVGDDGRRGERKERSKSSDGLHFPWVNE